MLVGVFVTTSLSTNKTTKHETKEYIEFIIPNPSDTKCLPDFHIDFIQFQLILILGF